MKCVRYKDGVIDRISDEQAQEAVRRNEAIYVAKEIWKKEVRDAD